LEIRPFEEADLDAAADLLAARHAVHRRAEPLLDARYEDPAAAREEIAELWSGPDASGAVALAGGRAEGYLIGVPSPNGIWGPNIWVTPAGHAVAAAETIRDLYAVAARRWAADGRTAHYALVPATDPALVDAWFRLGFGQQQVHAVRETTSAGTPAPAGVTIRRAAPDDIPALAALELSLPEHQARSPVFSSGPTSTLDEIIAEWEESIDDADYATFVAERDGVVVGSGVGCDVRVSRSNTSLIRPARAGFLGFAAVLPQARGTGVGQALGRTVLHWAASAGYPAAVTDWRASNLLSSRAWARLGFRPAFLRLHRMIGH